MSKNAKKTFLARDGFIAETYDVKFNLKKIEKICKTIGFENNISHILSKLILDDDMFALSFDIHNLIECISADNMEIFRRLFKVIQFCVSDEIFEPHLHRDSFFRLFPNIASSQQIEDIMHGRLDNLVKKGKSK